MKKYLLIATAFIGLSAFSGDNIWKNDAAHSQLGFTVTHLGVSHVSGTFNEFKVSAVASKADFSDAAFELTGKVASVDTRVEMRDKHLQSPDFFDAEKYPEFTFKSTGLTPNGKNKYKLAGNLTLHGVTRPVTLVLVYNGTVENPMSKKPTAGFDVSGSIKRSDFGIGDKFPDGMVSDVVEIHAGGEFSRE